MGERGSKPRPLDDGLAAERGEERDLIIDEACTQHVETLQDLAVEETGDYGEPEFT